MLTLIDPGLGTNVMCNVSASQSNPDFFSDCDADIFVDACKTDCSGKIIFPNTPPNQIAVNDRCGVCNGDGQSCLDCTTQTQTEDFFNLDGTALRQKRIVQKSIQFLRRVTNSNIGSDILTSAENLYIQNWSLVWSIPATTVDCNNTQFCSTVELTTNVADYDANAVDLRDLAISTARLARTKNKSTRRFTLRRAKVIARRLVKRANSTYEEALATSSTINTTTDLCTKKLSSAFKSPIALHSNYLAVHTPGQVLGSLKIQANGYPWP
ncbi:MAG: hypothetical protein R3A13_03320 [Bdellovibrionota bacterium]